MISFLKPHLLVGALALILATPAHAAHYKVFLLGGQSNMTGNGLKTSDLTEAQKAPQDDVWIYGGTDESASKLGSLQPGFGGPYGPELSFGRAIADGRPYENFALIKYSKGGTNLHTDWDPTTGNMNNRFKSTVGFGLEALTKAGHTYEVVGMLWTQGERDAAHERTTAEYEADLNEFIADIRTLYGADVAFFVSRLSILQTGREPGLHDIRAAQENVAAADPKAYLIDTDSFAMGGDNLHFTGTGIVALGNAFGQAYLNSLPVDASAPQIDTLSPVHTAPAVEPTANLSITFDEEVVFGTGNITLRQTGGTLVESYDVAAPSTNLTLSGNTLTIDPSSLLAASTGYYIEIAATAIVDHSGIPFAGISSDGTWSFTTSAGDVSAPTLNARNPANGANNVRINQNLSITLSENIAFGSGNIELRLATGGTLVESYDVASPPANLSISGGTLTINPTNDLLPSTGYYVEIDAAAIDDHAGNSFAGLNGSGAWAFTTVAPVIDGSEITATASRTDFNSDGTARGTPDKTIDGSGLSGGEHGSATGTYCLAPTTIYTPVEDQWFQWDLGASHTLGSIHVWNFDLRSVDIYFSNVAIPGGTGSGNWTRLGGASLELPAAGSPNTGFDLATATGTTLPTTEIRYIRFEANTNWSGGNGVALSEIQFSAGPAGPDTFAPGVSSFSPDHTTTEVDPTTDLVITFNEDIAFGSGNITLRQSGGALIENFDVGVPSPRLSLSGDTVTINPTADLADATTYYVEIDGTAIEDLTGNSFAGFSGGGTWSFTTVVPDTTAPTVSTLNPSNGANDINSSNNLIITFNEDVAFGSGNITLRQSGGALVESFDVGSPSPGLSVSGNTVTINPTADLALLTTYYVEIGGTAIEDLSGNPFAGYSGDGSWSFTTVAPETTAPTIDSLNPSNGQNSFSPTGNLQITFTEQVVFGTGNITLRESGGSVVESFDVANPPSGLTLSGATVTIDPGSALGLSTTYYVEIDATAIDDLAGNSFAGFLGNGTWSFTTAASLQVATVDSSGFNNATSNAVDTTGSLDWGYVSRKANNNQSGGFGSISEVNATGQDFGDLTLGGYGNLTTVSGSSSIGTVNFTEGAPSDVLSAAFTAGSNADGWYSFDGNGAHGDMRGMDGGEQDVWTLKFNDLGIGQFAITVYLGVSQAQNNKVFDMDYSLIDSNTVSGTSTSAAGSTYSLVTSPESFNLFTYNIVVTTTTAGADLSLTFGGVSGANGGEVLLSGYTVASTTTTDTSPPAVSTLNPDNTATEVDPASNLVITFNEDVAFDTGNITLRQSGGALVESFDVASPPAGLTLSGATVTLNPTSNLDGSTGYYVEIDATAIKDLASNSFSGFSGDGTWSFTTAAVNTTPPSISSLSPAHTSSEIDPTSNLVITFSEDVVLGTGNITLRQSGGALVENFDVATPPAGLTLSGNTVTINPSSDLDDSTTYYVEIDATAIDDLAGNSFAGFNGDGIWSFTTSNSATTAAITYVGSQFDIDHDDSRTTDGWHSSTLAKPLDIDGNSVLGSDGYLIYRDIKSNPTYATVTDVAPNKNGGWGLWDDPSNTSGSDIGGGGAFHDAGAGIGDTTVALLQFVITNAIPAGETLRVGVLFDVVGGTGTAQYILEQTVGGTATATTPNQDYDAASLDVAFFDITGFSIGDTFVIKAHTVSATGYGAGFEQVAGIAFDTGVISPPGETFADWIGGFSGLEGLTGLNDDADGDGIDNGVENYFGTFPNEFSQGLVADSVTGNTFTFTHPLSDNPATDLSATYRWSKDLATFHADGASQDGTTVNFAQGTPSGGMVTVTATITGTALERLFVDIEVRQD